MARTKGGRWDSHWRDNSTCTFVDFTTASTGRRGEFEFVDGLPRDECDDPKRPGLNIYLRHDLVLHNTGHDSCQAVPGRFAAQLPRIGGRMSAWANRARTRPSI